MEKNFMINFHYKGRQIYANVHEVKHSPAVYHVQFIDHIEPQRIELHEVDGRITPDLPHTDTQLVEMVIAAIKKHPDRI
ncbi:MAG TPA: hypothetical protein VD996_00695 [Chitinophagaceae bacterium]|nr:hypothetical protein [Chitinophagaceae bacterium]